MSSADFLESLDSAARASGRSLKDISVLAVSKGQPVEKLSSLSQWSGRLNIVGLGESYLDELLLKKQQAQGLAWSWHFIGRLQSRKLPQIISEAAVLHAVSRLKEVEILHKELHHKPQFYLQINVSGEAQKNGASPAELESLVDHLRELSLADRCLGLMCMPAPLEEIGEAELRKQFSVLRDLRDRYLPGKKLNMGTSGDYELAIKEGADLIRLGTLLFGGRVL